MIIDRVENMEYYESILPGLKNGLKTLQRTPVPGSGKI